MRGRFFLAWVAVFVAWMAGGFLVHGMLLHDDYAKLVPGLFLSETEAQQRFPLMILAHLMMAGAFVWIYARGIEPKPWLGQGLRFGLAVALLGVVPLYIIHYVVQPMPGDLVVKQILFQGIVMLIVGAVAAFVYRSSPAKS